MHSFGCAHVLASRIPKDQCVRETPSTHPKHPVIEVRKEIHYRRKRGKYTEGLGSTRRFESEATTLEVVI